MVPGIGKGYKCRYIKGAGVFKNLGNAAKKMGRFAGQAYGT
jgi:hypothetical protein